MILDVADEDEHDAGGGDEADADAPQIVLGDVVHVGGERPYACLAKLIGKERRLPVIGFDDESTHDGRGSLPEEPAEEQPEPTHTLMVVTGRGRTPEDARRTARRQLAKIQQQAVRIQQTNFPVPELIGIDPTPKPPEVAPAPADPPPQRGFFARVFKFWKT